MEEDDDDEPKVAVTGYTKSEIDKIVKDLERIREIRKEFDAEVIPETPDKDKKT